MDADLSGLMVGMTLLTKPEEIYRALIEATAYGTRMIVDTFEENNVPVKEVYAAGGIAQKNEMLMQIYADVLGLPDLCRCFEPGDQDFRQQSGPGAGKRHVRCGCVRVLCYH